MRARTPLTVLEALLPLLALISLLIAGAVTVGLTGELLVTVLLIAAATAGVQPTNGAGEWQQTPPPARTEDRETAWSSYEDTQPELPVMRPAPESRSSTAESGPAGSASGSTDLTEAPASAPPAPKAETGPAEDSRPKTNGAQEAAKPAGRLLPWEPMAEPTTEPMKKSKAAEPKPERTEPAAANKPVENTDRSEPD